MCGLGASAGLADDTDELDPFAADEDAVDAFAADDEADDDVAVPPRTAAGTGADGAAALGVPGDAGTADSPGTATPLGAAASGDTE